MFQWMSKSIVIRFMVHYDTTLLFRIFFKVLEFSEKLPRLASALSILKLLL